jgi:hypothetical protein
MSFKIDQQKFILPGYKMIQNLHLQALAPVNRIITCKDVLRLNDECNTPVHMNCIIHRILYT